jgi:hypothetical protein
MNTDHDKANELRARMITGSQLWELIPQVEISLDIDTVRFIGRNPDDWHEGSTYDVFKAISEACREWCKANPNPYGTWGRRGEDE